MLKRADELKSGDAWLPPLPPGFPPPGFPPVQRDRLVVLNRLSNIGTQVRCVMGALDTGGGIERLTSVRTFNPEDMVEVEAPTLTPAQQHADEMLDLLRLFGGGVPEDQAQRQARELVDRIDPPQPVTLEEALAAMVNLEPKLQAISTAPDRRAGPVLELIERARRAGQLQ